jgi:hypothetical protein
MRPKSPVPLQCIRCRGLRGALSTYHFAAMIFARLTYRESPRGIHACLVGWRAAAYRIGIRGCVTRTNLAYANEHRD